MASRKPEDPDTADAAAEAAFGAPGLAFAGAFGPAGECMLLAQARLLDESRRFWAAWLEQSRADATALMETGRRLAAHPGDPAAAVQAMAEWQEMSVRRLTLHARNWTEFVAGCSGHVLRGEVEAGKAVLDDTRRIASGGEIEVPRLPE